ncbi:hypothetical protein IJF91_01890 [Candidatus Saccharibacteria bacterium]|nr:hypothetical protein [Candidatus Saccharibacteria bacterium]
MTKSTKFVAALGIAAGLGVAALPLGTFATATYDVTPYVDNTQSADVTVQLSIKKSVGIAVADGRSADGATGGRTYTCAANNVLPNSTATCTHVVSIGANTPATLTVVNATSETNTSLVGPTGSDPIPAQDGSAVVAGTAGWNITGGDLTNAGISTTAQTVDNLEAAGEMDVSMTYNFATNVDQMAGTYSDVITYTVTAD